MPKMRIRKPSYEELRQQRLEENKKKLEDLNITKLSQIVRESPKKSQTTKASKVRMIREEGFPVELRRSVRVANIPAPDYKEYGKGHSNDASKPRSYKRRCLSNRVYASDEARSYAKTKAEEIKSQLEGNYPAFIKPMLQSHVTGGFYLGLPRQFCKHLPINDCTITLIDEDGREYPTVYLSQKGGLSGGWRGFSLAHELVDGDALVFQLVKQMRFKTVFQVKIWEECSTTKPIKFSIHVADDVICITRNN